MITLDDIRDVADDLGWSFEVSDDYVSFENWTDVAGQDIFFETSTLDPEAIIEELWSYVDGYDVDEEFDMYNEFRGKNGVPSFARTLLEDIENAKEMWMELAEAEYKLLRQR